MKKRRIYQHISESWESKQLRDKMNRGDCNLEDIIKWLEQSWEPLGSRMGVKSRAKIKDN